MNVHCDGAGRQKDRSRPSPAAHSNDGIDAGIKSSKEVIENEGRHLQNYSARKHAYLVIETQRPETYLRSKSRQFINARSEHSIIAPPVW